LAAEGKFLQHPDSKKSTKILTDRGKNEITSKNTYLASCRSSDGQPGGRPGTNRVALAQQRAASVVYNLYATDGYVTLADGTVAYIYGFVGGRAGTQLTYQTSTAKGAGLNATIPLPAPTGGPITAAELPLAGNAQFPAP